MVKKRTQCYDDRMDDTCRKWKCNRNTPHCSFCCLPLILLLLHLSLMLLLPAVVGHTENNLTSHSNGIVLFPGHVFKTSS